MNSTDEPNSDNGDLDRLLHVAGPRVQPPEDLEREVRAAVHREWRAVVTARARRRRFVQVAIAAGLGAVALTVWLLNQAPTPSVVVASIERLIESGTVSSEGPASAQPLAEKQELHAGDTLYSFTDVLDRTPLSKTRGALRLRLLVVKNEIPSDAYPIMITESGSEKQRYNPKVVLDLDYWDIIARKETDV
jgi:hypothetical protein